jgi:FMN phosphatase YigB (HAD superfamily)
MRRLSGEIGELVRFASELLNALKARELRCVIVSNVQVRGAVEYQRDFEDFGIAHLFDAIVP